MVKVKGPPFQQSAIFTWTGQRRGQSGRDMGVGWGNQGRNVESHPPPKFSTLGEGDLKGSSGFPRVTLTLPSLPTEN